MSNVVLGKGTFSVVYKTKYKNEDSATKVMTPTSQSKHQLLSEVRALEVLQKTYVPRLFCYNLDKQTITMGFYPTTLLTMIQQFQKGEISRISNVRILKWVRQIVTTLRVANIYNFVHADLKPANILIDEHDNAILSDWGNAMNVKDLDFSAEDSDYQNSICSLWYRPPELLLESESSNESLDMWSVGCLIYELCTGMPLFGGTSNDSVLQSIFELFGTPEKDSPMRKTPNKIYKIMIDDYDNKPHNTRAWEKLKIAIGNDVLYNIMMTCLVIDPENRITAFLADI
jgi:serine/threonine protein kinase